MEAQPYYSQGINSGPPLPEEEEADEEEEEEDQKERKAEGRGDASDAAFDVRARRKRGILQCSPVKHGYFLVCSRPNAIRLFD